MKVIFLRLPYSMVGEDTHQDSETIALDDKTVYAREKRVNELIAALK
jgi:hypothetical protein